jgi:hypothetical protein
VKHGSEEGNLESREREREREREKRNRMRHIGAVRRKERFNNDFVEC